MLVQRPVHCGSEEAGNDDVCIFEGAKASNALGSQCRVTPRPDTTESKHPHVDNDARKWQRLHTAPMPSVFSCMPEVAVNAIPLATIVQRPRGMGLGSKEFLWNVPQNRFVALLEKRWEIWLNDERFWLMGIS